MKCLNYRVVVFTQYYECAQCNRTVQFKMVNFMLYEFHLKTQNKTHTWSSGTEGKGMQLMAGSPRCLLTPTTQLPSHMPCSPAHAQGLPGLQQLEEEGESDILKSFFSVWF